MLNDSLTEKENVNLNEDVKKEDPDAAAAVEIKDEVMEDKSTTTTTTKTTTVTTTTTETTETTVVKTELPSIKDEVR